MSTERLVEELAKYEKRTPDWVRPIAEMLDKNEIGSLAELRGLKPELLQGLADLTPGNQAFFHRTLQAQHQLNLEDGEVHDNPRNTPLATLLTAIQQNSKERALKAVSIQ